jgi:hypothetical protein
MPTPDKYEKTIQVLENRSARAVENLKELAQLETYKKLIGQEGMAASTLSGETESKMAPTIVALKLHIHQVSLILAVVEKAKALIAERPRQGKSAELEKLLTARSLSPLAPEEDSAVAEEVVGLISAKDLLDRLVENFEEIKKSVMAIDALWNYLPLAIARANDEMKQAIQLCETLGEDDEELLDVNYTLKTLQLKMQADPFGVKEILDRQVSPPLSKLLKHLHDTEVQRQQVEAEVRKARQKWDQLVQIRNLAQQAYDKAKAKVAAPPGLREAVPQEVLDDLGAWLKTLESTLYAGRWQASAVGVQRFLITVEDHLIEESKILKSNEIPLVILTELRGRLSGLQTKAARLKLDGKVLPPELDECAADGHRILYSKPVPLDLGEELVTKYAIMLGSFFTAEFEADMT